MDATSELEVHKNQVKFNEQLIYLTENVKDLADIVKIVQKESHQNTLEVATKYAALKSYVIGFVFCASILGSGFVWSMKTTANQMIEANEATNHTQSSQLQIIKNIVENHELRISALEQFRHINNINIKNGI